MSKLNCNVVRDILPLYADEVVCQDTKELVEEHLNGCEGCRQELFAMKVQVAMPVQANAAESLKKFKHRWSRKQILKGAAIALSLVVLVAGFLFLYGYGIPVKAEDVILESGLHCRIEYDAETMEQLSRGELPDADREWVVCYDRQDWELHIDTAKGRVITQSEWTSSHNINIYVRYCPIVFPWENDTYNTHGYTTGVTYEEDGDFTFTIICADEEIVYSMKEEGVWDDWKQHSPEFCSYCAE